MKKIIKLYLLILLSVLISCNTTDTNADYKNYETIDCNVAKYECLELIRENKDEIKEINYFSVIEDTFFSVANNASISIGIMYQSSCLDHF